MKLTEEVLKVLSLGLLNQAHKLNGNGEFYLQKQPKMRVRLVDGSSLAAAVVANSVAPGTDQIILAGNLDKVARAVAVALCKRNVKVWIIGEGTRFIPCSQFQPRMIRKDCIYLTTPAMNIPRTPLNMHSCEVTAI
ncbi:hypothetical protein E2562_020045 [Oryza meyeriana var. granulata]|uniref:Very-long-chain aldehyde decarbonylase CER1-like C-terminal domain-containing protein n=1 Tax=Oryza meyeriana var. granulata TaxID=110450 RepID=A0A6G1FAN7_9ORYZ|nr:hypothetical protein E2562_020045 [Oryza meyeriana var. granulata]